MNIVDLPVYGAQQQPVRAAKVAVFVMQALQPAPPDIHVAAPETVWRRAR